MTAGSANPRSLAERRTACAMMCSESPSTAAARARARSSSQPSAVAMPTTPNSPRVRVPVLSNTTMLISRAFSKRQPVAHQDAVLRAEGGGDGDHQGNGQAERVRAGDDEHGGHALDHHHVEPDGNGPGDGGDDGNAERDVEQPARRPVGQDLRARLALLRLAHQPHDAGQGRLVAGGRDLAPAGCRRR